MRKHSPRIDPAGITSSSSATPQISRRRFLFALSAGSAGAGYVDPKARPLNQSRPPRDRRSKKRSAITGGRGHL